MEQNADGTSPNTPPFGGVLPHYHWHRNGQASPTVGDTDTLLLQVVMLLTLVLAAPGETFTGGHCDLG